MTFAFSVLNFVLMIVCFCWIARIRAERRELRAILEATQEQTVIDRAAYETAGLAVEFHVKKKSAAHLPLLRSAHAFDVAIRQKMAVGGQS